jgi:hypothetical protein
MFLIALVPPLWFRIMDRRLDAWYARRQEGGLVSEANDMLPASS